MNNIAGQQDQVSANAFEPMPLHKIEMFTLEQLLEEYRFAAQTMLVEDPRRKIYLQMISAIGKFRFQDADWEGALLDYVIANSASGS